MADPLLHIKDAYYFEVPRALWPHHYESLDQVPQFLRTAHPDVTDPEVFAHELSGKVLIPQPFGELKNLYEASSGFCISKFMIIELIVAGLLTLMFVLLARRLAGGAAPRGRLTNMLEAFLVYLRDHVVRPAVGKHDADQFLPLLWTVFFFVLGCNLMGMLPWMGAPTGEFGTTLALACGILLTVFIAGKVKFGVVGFWLNQVPSMELPWYMSPLKVVIWIIEVFGMFIRHGILAVRLMANMVAGHLVLLGLMGLIVTAAEMGTGMFATVATISVAGCAAFSLLELFVAFLQAYIFTFLSALFIGAAVHRH